MRVENLRESGQGEKPKGGYGLNCYLEGRLAIWLCHIFFHYFYKIIFDISDISDIYIYIYIYNIYIYIYIYTLRLYAFVRDVLYIYIIGDFFNVDM